MSDFAIVASNKFKVSSTKVNGIKINNYYYAGKSAKIYNQLAKQTAVDSIKLFTKKYGPYPYSELDLTESPFGSDTGGMEYSGLVMIAQDTFARKKAASKEDYDSVIEDVSHEVAHQWFFNTVGNDEYTEPWLDEGMAEFSEDIIFDLSPTKTSALYQKLMKTKQDASLMKDVKKLLNQQLKTAVKNKQGMIINYPLNKIPKKYDEADTAYNGGKSFYSLLRYLMGEKKFDQAMRDYYQTYYLKQATGKDFIAIIKKYDNSKAVNDLIKRYISPKYLQ